MTDERWAALNRSLVEALRQAAWRFDEGVNDRVISDVADEMSDLLVATWTVRSGSSRGSGE